MILIISFMSDPNLDNKLANRYQLLETLGQGSMGKVYLAEDALLGDVRVAVKFLAQSMLSDRMRQRFLQEAKTCAQLGQKSIHIIRVTDYGLNQENIPFYVMEYLQGQSLSHAISISPLPIPRFLALTKQICLGLQAAHQGILLKGQSKPVQIIHRDIKPSNILIVQDSTLGELAKILDFGIAKLMQEEAEQTNCFMGTLAYASPEQMEGRELDSRSDIYSLGILMYQMLTGKLPLRANSHTFGGWYEAHRNQIPVALAEAEPDLKVPKLLEELVMSCLEKARESRPQDTGKVLRALAPLEERFVQGFRISQRINAALTRVPVNRRQNGPVAEAEQENRLCRLMSWPKTKPVAEIVFPHPLPASGGHLATVWAMMPNQEVAQRSVSTRYNTFICTMMPHPMVLWLTVLYSSSHGARWLPCYIDLKSKAGQEMGYLLGQSGYYKLLLFNLESPRRCAHVFTCHIAHRQKQLLQEWVLNSRVRPSIGSISDSKEVLRQELNSRLKPRVLQQLEAIYLDAGSEFAD